MFTGIIASPGKVLNISGRSSKEGEGLLITVRSGFKSIATGESLAVDGVCLTVTGKKKSKGGSDFTAEASEETLKRTTLKFLRPGDAVNLERALKAGGKMGGHFVQGHVDAVGRVLGISPEGTSRLFTFSYPPFLDPFIVPKGSIAVDGISLTVVDSDAGSGSFSVSVLPFTEKNTSLARKRPGDRVNLEADILAKIVAKQVQILKRENRGTDELYQKVQVDWSEIMNEGAP
jgi:riboflavin synthase